MKKPKVDPKFMPGSFGCHEALHMAGFIQNAFEKQLLEHPSIQADPEWKGMAEHIWQDLFDLYQAIGAKHLS